MSSPTLGKAMVIIAVVVLLSWLLHESAHYFTGVALGHSMSMSLNRTIVTDGEVSTLDARLIDAAGPLITLIQAVCAAILLRYRDSFSAFAVLITAVYMRALALGLSFFNPNDEARISETLHIGTLTLPTIVVAFLCYLAYRAIKRHSVSRSTVLKTLATVIVMSSMIIVSDRLFV